MTTIPYRRYEFLKIEICASDSGNDLLEIEIGAGVTIRPFVSCVLVTILATSKAAAAANLFRKQAAVIIRTYLMK